MAWYAGAGRSRCETTHDRGNHDGGRHGRPCHRLTMTEARQRAIGIAFIVAAVSVFACVDATAKFLMRDYSVLIVVWARNFFQMVAMIIFLAPTMKLDLLRTKRPGIQLARGLLLTTSSLFFFTGVASMQLAEASAITFLAPLFIALLAGPVLRERVPLPSWLAIVAGLIGVQFIIRPGSDVFSWAALLPVMTAICMAIYQLLTRHVAHTERTLTSLFYPSVIGSIILSALLPFAGPLPVDPWPFALLVTIGVLGGAGHFLLIRAYQHAPASTVAPFMYAQLIGALSLGYLLFGDLPDGWALLGMGIIVTSGILLVTHQHRSR
ncbi:MAG: DMT family transporter [Betaproteobacteria bacterium]|nr:DMT family transporter [Betaproteobacteria bacterium]